MGFVALAGKDFFHTRVKTLVTLGQVQKITSQIEKDMRAKKVDYTKSKETDTAKLRLSLQELFTKVVIRRALCELAKTKAEAITRREYLADLDVQAGEKYRTQQARVTEENEKVKAAKSGFLNLLNFVEGQLGDDEEQIYMAGSVEYTMDQIKDFLNKASDEEQIELPRIINGDREDGNDDDSIYKNEFDQLPQEVKEYFMDATTLIDRANQAAKEEQDAAAEYNEIYAAMNAENQKGMQINDLREKIENIEETEDIANRILEVGTFWIYEGTPAPGDNDKLHMSPETSKRLIDNLVRISNDIENPDLGTKSLKEEITNAKNHIKKLKAALPRYFEVPELNTAIFDIEANIVVHEAIVTRKTKKEEEVRRASNTRESRRCSARDVFAQEEAGKEKEKNKRKRKEDERQRSSNNPDLVDRITKIKMMTSNAPLTSIPAGQFSERKSMKPIS